MVIISTGLPCSTMWNLSRSVVPPEVNSMSSVALCSLAFCSSQCPTSVFKLANASALPPAAATRREPASPANNATAIRIRAAFFMAFLLKTNSRGESPCVPGNLLCTWVRLHYSEQIAFGVSAIGEIADRGNWRLWHDQLASCVGDFLDGVVHR